MIAAEAAEVEADKYLAEAVIMSLLEDQAEMLVDLTRQVEKAASTVAKMAISLESVQMLSLGPEEEALVAVEEVEPAINAIKKATWLVTVRIPPRMMMVPVAAEEEDEEAAETVDPATSATKRVTLRESVLMTMAVTEEATRDRGEMMAAPSVVVVMTTTTVPQMTLPGVPLQEATTAMPGVVLAVEAQIAASRQKVKIKPGVATTTQEMTAVGELRTTTTVPATPNHLDGLPPPIMIMAAGDQIIKKCAS